MRMCFLIALYWITAMLPVFAEDVLICRHFIDPNDKHGTSGSSLRLDYNVDGVKAFNGFWMKLGSVDKGNNFDASGYKTLSLWVKGDKAAGIPSKVKVEVKGDAGDVIGQYYIGNITSDWSRVEIPLETYVTQGVQLAALNELVIVFENKAAMPGAVKGAIWVDDITLEGGAAPRVIADFDNATMNNLGGAWGTFTP